MSRCHRDGDTLYDSVTAGGSLFRLGGTLRTALDAALSSPSGIGIAVDDAGAVIGGAMADDVIDALDEQRQEQEPEDEPPPDSVEEPPPQSDSRRTETSCGIC